MSPSKGPVDPRLLRLARPAARPLSLLVGLSVLQAIATVAVSLAAATVVVRILEGDAWLRTLGMLTTCLLVRAAVQAASPVAAHRVSARVVDRARRRGLAALARRGPAWAAGRGAGSTDLATVLSTGLEPLRPWFANYLPALVVAAVLPVSVVVLMAAIDLTAAVTVALTLPLVPLFAALIGWATQRRAAEQYDRGGALAGHFLDVVRGLVTLKLFDRADRQVEQVRDASSRYAGATTRVLSVAFLSSTALDLVATISVGLVAVGAGVRLAGGEMALWPALAVIVLAPEAYRPLREAGAQFHESAQASAVMDRLDELTGPAGEEKCRNRRSEQQIVHISRNDGSDAGALLEMHDVELNYPGRRAPVRLPDLTASPGELVAVVGPSGSGKTTLLRILAGVERPHRGSVRSPSCELVPQRPALPLARTVREALTEGLPAPDHPADDGALQSMLDRLGVKLPSGLDTPLGDGGAGISTGQRQRLAIARAVLGARARLAEGSNAPVLLLDEPTAHLDVRAERAVVGVLEELARAGAVVIVTAHRPGLIAAADRTVTVSPADHMDGGVTAATERPPESETAPGPHPAGNGPPRPSDGRHHGRRPRRGMLAALRHRWTRLSPRNRLVLAAMAGALSVLSGVGLTVAAAWLIVRADAQPPILALSIAVVCVRAFAITRPLWRYLERLASHDAGLSQLASWRADVVAHLIPQVPGRLTARRGALLTRVVDDVDTRLDGQVRGAVPAGAALGALTVVAVVAVWWHPSVLIPLVGALALAGAVVPSGVTRADRRLAGPGDAARTDLRDAVVAAVENPDELASDSGVLLRQTRARAAVAERHERSASRIDGLARGGGELAGTLLVLGCALLSGLAFARGAVTPEAVGVLVLGSLTLTETIGSLVPALRVRAAGEAARRRLGELASDVRRPPALPSGPTAVGRKAGRGPGPGSGGFPGSGLRAWGLAVGWQDSIVREGIDLDVTAGETAELHWPSGAGKSTLAATLVGLVPPHAGTFVAGGVPHDVPDGAELRRHVGLAGDADHIFATTVRENLRLARPHAGDAELIDALEQAQLGGWLEGLVDGLDTWLDSGGHALSGGERRRLVLARALLRDPGVLVLDEPESGIDPDTAAALLGSVRSRARQRGRAVLVMAHVRHPKEHLAGAGLAPVASDGP
ncbi:thiol reductant ABC exporter subunit CydD [Georgenia halophila]|uniref:Thiol reductant ABC exporter subunit CydD n=1 Tax=Georgenia halophila TaxID=620889 RepID=A0ABP8LBT1_9MICO